MELTTLIDAFVEVGILIGLGIIGMGAALSLPDLLPHVRDAKDARSALHPETY
jgi:hypothetical protein